MAKNGKLTPWQARAIEALLTAPDLKTAAKTANVGYRTLRDWLTQPHFKTALSAAQDDVISATVRRLASMSGKAVDVLVALIEREDIHPAVKLRAADIALGRLLSLRELHDFEQRLVALEAAQRVSNDKKHGPS